MSAASLKDRLAEAEKVVEIWADPQPLRTSLLPVKRFDAALLPAPLRTWVMDIVERMQVPAEFVAASAMVAVGSVIGRKVAIRPQANTDWTEVPNFWGAIIGPPGVMKSPSMKQAFGPLYKLCASEKARFDQDKADWDAGEMERDMRADARKKAAKERLSKDPSASIADLMGGDEAEPILRRYIANDTSYQSLAELLRTCAPNGLLVSRDEIMSLVRSLDDEGNVEARGFYLTAWNGTDSYTFDRIGRGFNLHIPAVTVSLFGSTQPARIREYLAGIINGTVGDDGLIQRFGFMVWPDIPAQWKDVDRPLDPTARQEAYRAFQRLSELTPASVGAEIDQHDKDVAFLRFDDEALGEFRTWRADLEARLRSGELGQAFESHLAKYRKLVPTIALAFHLTEGRTGPIGLASLLPALGWAELLESHAARIYGAAANGGAEGAKTILARIRKGDLVSPFTVRDLKQRNWSGLGDERSVTAAIECLEDHHIIRVKAVLNPSGGRPSQVVSVNPKVMK